MALVSPAYCDLSDVERLFSSYGVTAYSDHDGDGQADSEVVNDCINQATEEINLYCQQWYEPADLDNSTLINRWCTVMATTFLCERRGNPVPESLQAEFARIAEKLERILAGTLKIPGLAMRDDMRPSYSNLTVDRRYQRSRIRVTRQNSSDAPTRLTQDATLDIPTVFD
ncbi:MAG: phage protein Gp36 family protein [Pyrinomonadaceae bacterium]